MSIKTFDSALDFVPERTTRSTGVWAGIGSFGAGIVTSLAAIREGIALAGEYKALTNRGVASDVAARKVFEKIGH